MPTLAEIQANLVTLQRERIAARDRAIVARQEAARAVNASNQAAARATAADAELATIQNKLESM